MTISVPQAQFRSNEQRLAQLAHALEHLAGGTHAVEDILGAIATGHMQSFANGNTWVVTDIVDAPRKRILEIFLIIGDLADLEPLIEEVFAFAKERGCVMVRGFGRQGWGKFAVPRGWRVGASIYIKDVGD